MGLRELVCWHYNSVCANTENPSSEILLFQNDFFHLIHIKSNTTVPKHKHTHKKKLPKYELMKVLIRLPNRWWICAKWYLALYYLIHNEQKKTKFGSSNKTDKNIKLTRLINLKKTNMWNLHNCQTCVWQAASDRWPKGRGRRCELGCEGCVSLPATLATCLKNGYQSLPPRKERFWLA